MEIHGLDTILAQCQVLHGLSPQYLKLLAECAANVRFSNGQYIFHEGQEANRFYLIREGNVSVEVHAPGATAITVQTLGVGEVLGWSWLFAPYRWHFDARALVATRAIALDGKCLRDKCEKDSVLGYELMKRFARIMAERIAATNLQLLDVYGSRKGKDS